MSKLCDDILAKFEEMGFIEGPTLLYEKWCDKCKKNDVFIKQREYPEGVSIEHDEITGRGDGLAWIDECLLEHRYQEREGVVVDDDGVVFIEVEWEGDDNDEP